MSYVIPSAQPAIGRAKLVAIEDAEGRLAAAFVAPDRRIRARDLREETLEIAKKALASKKGDNELLDTAKDVLNSGIADIEVERSAGNLILTLTPAKTKVAKATVALVHTGKFESSSSEKAIKLPQKGNSPIFAHLVNNDKDEPMEVWDLDPKDPRLYLIARKGLTIRSFGEPTDRFVGAAKEVPKETETPPPAPAEKTLKEIVGAAIKNGEYQPLEEKGIKTVEDFLKAALGPSGSRLALQQFKKKSGITAITKGRLEAAVKAIQAEKSI